MAKTQLQPETPVRSEMGWPHEQGRHRPASRVAMIDQCAPWSDARPGEPKRRAAARSFVIYKLRELGPLTNRELARAMQMKETEVAPRVSELVNEFHAVRDTGRRKRPLSGKGRKQVVWEAVT